jgi:hypothetical protein
MKTNSINARPPELSESTINAYGQQTRRSRTGAIKLLQPPTPPDEATIRRLNELAQQNPFCTLYRCKKYDLL